jgi:hypothetical protein
MDQHKLEWLECCLMVLTQYAAEGTAFLNRTVTGDESWELK